MGKRKPRVKLSKKERYEKYIQSERWNRRKIEYYGYRQKICWRCSTTENIHLHHHTYLGWGTNSTKIWYPFVRTATREFTNFTAIPPATT